MKFSEYIVLETTGGSVDPLGYLRPSATLGDNLFPQFTVLSNRPAYHGFLAHAFKRLAGRPQRSARSDFSVAFRDLEVLWGILNCTAGTPILNVTKYARFVERGDFRLSEARRHGVLYAKQNYGTLGHYSTPSISWRILNKEGSQLTSIGQRLGDAWARRKGLDFGEILDDWLADRPIGDIVDQAVADLFCIDASPAPAERQCWQDLIAEYCFRRPAIAPLWKQPLPGEIQEFAAAEGTYLSYHESIIEHYHAVPEVRTYVELVFHFEWVAALAQFIFEWEYVRRLDEAREVGLESRELEQQVAATLVESAAAYVKLTGYRDAGMLFRRLSEAGSYGAVASTILTHHANHQRSKGAAQYFDGERVLLQGRVDAREFAGLFDRISGNPAMLEKILRWRYRRDWHFNRALRWLDYAGVME